jgi:hypothetical protein
LIIGGLVVAVAILSIFLYNSQNKSSDFSIKVSEDGIEVDGN